MKSEKEKRRMEAAGEGGVGGVGVGDGGDYNISGWGV